MAEVAVNAINLLDPIYGVVPGAPDNTIGMQAALAAAIAGPGVLDAPPGVYNHGHLDLVGVGSLTIRGAQGYQWWGPTTNRECRTVFNCIAQDDQDGIGAHQAQGLVFENIQFSYNEGFAGIVLNFGHPNIGIGANTCLVQRCHFTSDRNGTYITAKAHIGLANTVCVTVRDSSLMGARSLIRGLESAENFSNDNVIDNVSFERCTVGQIVNPGMWDINWPTFEFTGEDGLRAPVAITSDLTSTATGAAFYNFFVVRSPKFWDSAHVSQKCIVQPPGVVWHIRIHDGWFGTFNTTHIELNGPGSVVIDGSMFTANVPANAPTLIDLGDPATAKKDVVSIRDNWWNDGSPADNALTVKNAAGHKAVCIENNANKGPWDTSSAGGGGGPPYDPLLGTFTLTNPPAPFGNSVSATYSGDRVMTSGNNTYHIGDEENRTPLMAHGDLYLGGDLLMGQSGTRHDVTYGNQAGTVPCFVSIFGSLTIKAYTPLVPHDGEVWRENNTKDGVKMRINGVTETFAFKGD